jgi:hypothetical protein
MPGASFRRRSRSRDSSLNTLATPLAITPIPSNKYGERRETLQEFKPSKRFSFRFRMNKIAAILFAKLSEIKVCLTDEDRLIIP